jgi:hypothetical protein
MPTERANRIAGGAAGMFFAVFLAMALIHFAGWTQSHSTAVTGIMYCSLLLSVALFLFWFRSQGRNTLTADIGRAGSEAVTAGAANVSSGNIHFAPLIQVGNVGAPSASPVSPPAVTSMPSVASAPSAVSDLDVDPVVDLPDLQLAFSQGTASVEDSAIRFSDQGDYCISVRVYNRPAAKMNGALVARKIVASVSLNIGSKVASIESSCWIDHDANQIDLRPGAYAHALLVFPARNWLTMYENQNPLPRRDLEWNSSFPEPERVQLPLSGLSEVRGEIHVISRANHLKHVTLAHRKFIISIGDIGSSHSKINVKWADSSDVSAGPTPSRRQSVPESHGAIIELLDVEIQPIHLDDEGEIWRIGQMPDWRARALLLPFYLDPKSSAPGARLEYAMAHLVFISDASTRIRIDHGCWINAALDTAEIRLGETKRLILAIRSEDPSVLPIALSTNRIRVGWQNEFGDRPFEQFELSPGKYEVEVTLIWGGNSEFQKTFSVPLTLP